MAKWVRQLLRMQEIRSSNPPVVTGICDPNKSRARHHRSLKLGSKLKHPSIKNNVFHKARLLFALLTWTTANAEYNFKLNIRHNLIILDTLKQIVSNLPTNCLSVFDHFVGLAFKGLA